MKEPEMREVARWMNEVVSDPRSEAVRNRVRTEIKDLCDGFPAPGIGC